MTSTDEPSVEGLPSAYAELAEWLEATGFARHVIVDAPPNGFAYRAITYSRGPVEVRFESDRGSWLVEIRLATWDQNDWFEPVVWHAYISGSEAARGPVSPAREAGILKHDLRRIDKIASEAPEVALSKLRDLQEEYVLRDLDPGLD